MPIFKEKKKYRNADKNIMMLILNFAYLFRDYKVIKIILDLLGL